MKKKLLLLLGVLLALPAFAQDFTYEGIIYTVIDEDAKTCQTKEGYHVKGQNYKSYQNVTGDLILPAYPKNGDTEYKLTEIADWSFYNLTGITSLTLPATIQRIGEDAFYCCKQLSNVILNEGLESIGGTAFQDCGLKNITIPSTIVSMGSEPFLCNPMESITMLSIMPPFNESSDEYPIFYSTSITTTTVLELTKENASNYLNSEFNMFANINVDGKLLQKYTHNGLDYLLYDTGDPAHGEAVLLKGDYNDLTNVQIPARFDVGAD
ncbi:MAG: leucine-rich repeat domain-containing protein, partial [Muribaculaceae bacterium]|nr:leucine-rich repeat domain-containing protein [Muribaculaceae bacterium]